MKQGTLINRIVMLLLLAAVLVYLGVSAWRSFRDPYTLVLSYAYTVDDSLEATGFLVREERVLASPGGIVDLLPAGRRWPCSTRMTPAWRGRRSYRA